MDPISSRPTSSPTIEDRFDRGALDSRWQWLNPPQKWGIEPSGLALHPDPNTDFWQETHYGFRADNGHFLFEEIDSDFLVTTRVRFEPVHQYDQAGLMIRSNATNWMKTSVEHEPDGPSRLGAVVTRNGFSDWSVQDFPRDTSEICLRIRRERSDFTVEYAVDEESQWTLMRIAHLDLEPASTLRCGLYACSPKEAGFRATFAYIRIESLADATHGKHEQA